MEFAVERHCARQASSSRLANANSFASSIARGSSPRNCERARMARRPSRSTAASRELCTACVGSAQPIRQGRALFHRLRMRTFTGKILLNQKSFHQTWSISPRRCALGIVRRETHRSDPDLGRSLNPKFRRLRHDSGQRCETQN